MNNETTFKCENCGGVFTKITTDEERLAEAKQVFPWLKPEDAAIVCDVCYKRIMASRGVNKMKKFAIYLDDERIGSVYGSILEYCGEGHYMVRDASNQITFVMLYPSLYIKEDTTKQELK